MSFRSSILHTEYFPVKPAPRELDKEARNETFGIADVMGKLKAGIGCIHDRIYPLNLKPKIFSSVTKHKITVRKSTEDES